MDCSCMNSCVVDNNTNTRRVIIFARDDIINNDFICFLLWIPDYCLYTKGTYNK